MQSSSVIAEMDFAALSVFAICNVVLVSSTHLQVLHAEPHGATAAADARISPSASVWYTASCSSTSIRHVLMYGCTLGSCTMCCEAIEQTSVKAGSVSLMEAHMCLIT